MGEESLNKKDQEHFLFRPVSRDKVQLLIPTAATVPVVLISLVEKHMQQLFALPPSLCTSVSWNELVDGLRFLLSARSNYLHSLWLLCVHFRMFVLQSHKANKGSTFTCKIVSQQKTASTVQIPIEPDKIEILLHSHCQATEMLFSSFPVSTLRFSMVLPKDLRSQIQLVVRKNAAICVGKNILCIQPVSKHTFSFPDKKYHPLFVSFATDHVWQ